SSDSRKVAFDGSGNRWDPRQWNKLVE
ncbi:uncharacterized protein METZ01_LOCUS368723, partial [marine metagenome]